MMSVFIIRRIQDLQNIVLALTLSIPYMALLSRNERQEWLRFDTQSYIKEEQLDIETRLEKHYYRKVHWVQTLDIGGLTEDLDQDITERISFGGDFLGPVPSYTFIREPLRRLCHQLITFTISRRGQTPENVTTTDLFFLKSMDEGTVIGRHFWVITEQTLQTLTVEVHGLTIIDIEELIKLRIYKRVLDVVSWVAVGPQRQQVGAAGEAAQVDPEAPQDADRSQRVEEEVYQMRQGLCQQSEMIKRLTTKHARYSSWMIDCMTELMEQRGMMFMRFDGTLATLATNSHLQFERRRVRPRTTGASTSAGQQTHV
ncbi:hypothetical protein Tco_0598063 [Tanacetum coccineum]